MNLNLEVKYLSINDGVVQWFIGDELDHKSQSYEYCIIHLHHNTIA